MDVADCATCPWWSRLPDRVEFRWVSESDTQEEIRTTNDRGECRRYPPRPTRDFALTEQDDWCGEHPERRPE
jgi:hypothetical protein